jgi:uncharacterized protein (DUF2384 family)
MNANLESTLSRTLGQALGLTSCASEMALARADREQLGAALMHSLTGQNLLSPADVYRIVPRRTWSRRKAEVRLSRDEFDGLYRLVRVQTLAELVFGDAVRAQAWLHEIDQGYFA